MLEGAAEDALELSGALVPAEGTELVPWPERWSGELLLLEVREHGSVVSAGEELARLEDRGYRDQLEAAERAVQKALRAAAHGRTRVELDAGRREEERAAAELKVERARSELAAWLDQGLPLDTRSAELAALAYQYRIDDSSAELAQLESMYSDDELVDATEDIVLERARRDLARQKLGQQLALDQRAYRVETELRLRTEDRRLALEQAERALDRLVTSHAIAEEEAAASIDELLHALDRARRTRDELGEDGRLFTVIAPHGGLLLHGGLDDYVAGSKRPAHRRGGRLTPRTPAFTIVPGGAGHELRLQLDEEQHGRILGAGPAADAVEVRLHGAAAGVANGRLEVDTMLAAGSQAGGGARFDARVVLEGELPGAVPGGSGTLVLRGLPASGAAAR